MKRNQYDTLVLGIGNEILCDDGIGPRLCDFLKEKFADKPIQFEKLNVGGLEVLEFINGYETVVFIDAIKTVDGQIGEVYNYTPDDFRETLHLSNLHDTNFITALELGKSLDFKIPKNMYIIAVEIKEDMVFSEYFTEELAINYDEIKEKVITLLYNLIPDILNKKNKPKSEHIQ
ncbi:MAG: hydrogenase maturation protease [Draconibacterium sp.]|nr:hydrogenase maturation protease [Draconibacterium sp.]